MIDVHRKQAIEPIVNICKCQHNLVTNSGRDFLNYLVPYRSQFRDIYHQYQPYTCIERVKV